MKRNGSSGRFLAVGPLPLPIGGDTVSFFRLVNSRVLKDAGIELEVLDTSRKEKESKLGRRLDIQDVAHAVSFFVQAWWRMRHVDGILIWANNRFAYTLGLLLILLYKHSGRKVILKLFGGDFEEDYGSLPKWYRWVIRRIFEKVHYLLPQTKELCRFFMERMGIPQEQVIHFPNFLPFQPLPPHTSKKKGSVSAVFVGQIREEKGVFDILEAMKQDQEMTCTFHGPIFAGDRERFRQLLEELPGAGYGGILASDQVLQTIAGYDVLLLPSYHLGEGYPAVIVEAFFASVPVIATAWRMIPELVLQGENGFLVSVNAPDQIAACIKRLSQEPELHERMRIAANRAASQFTEERVVGHILLSLLRPHAGEEQPSIRLQRG